MANQNIFQFPVFTIKETKPLLKKDEVVYAYAMTFNTEDGDEFKVYEDKGLDVSFYLGQKVECLLEITRGHFRYKDENGIKPQNVTVFQYQWLKRPYEFFPELVSLRENSSDSRLKEFDKIAETFFKNWGLNELNIGIYKAKPMLHAPIGIFMLNEYEFEEQIEYLELNDEVFIQIDELYLRGIRPYQPAKESEHKERFIVSKPKEEMPKPKQNEESRESKKRKFFFD